MRHYLLSFFLITALLATTPSIAADANFASLTDEKVYESARTGNIEAALEYSKRLQLGLLGKKPDIKQAVLWLQRAAQQSNAEAALTLAMLYKTGQAKSPAPDSITHLTDFALYLLNEKAKQGNALAMAKLGQIYAEGILVKKDHKTALAWLTKAVAGGDPQAKLVLGRMTIWGISPDYPEERALRYLQDAANANIPDAWLILGMAYSGAYGGTVNHPRAFNAFKHAAKLGLSEGKRQMGLAYFSGLGVSKNNSKGLALVTEAAEAKNMEAMVNVASAHRMGVGTAKNPAQYVQWLSRAAERNLAEAQYLLGLAYLNGEGVSRNINTATTHLKAARSKGHVMAKRALEGLEKPTLPHVSALSGDTDSAESPLPESQTK